MNRRRLIWGVLLALAVTAPVMAGDTLYVDLSGVDNIVTNPPLTDQQKTDLKNCIIADIQANFDVAGVDITVTTDSGVAADRTVHIKSDIGSEVNADGTTSYFYGEWYYGSRDSNVHLGNFFSRHGSDYKTDGQWDIDKLCNGIGRTAAHEVAHSYSVGHNKDGNSPSKMTEGGLVPSSTRANTEWIFDDHSGEVMNQNLGKKPCQTTSDYDEEYIEPMFWMPPMFPNPDWDPADPNSYEFNDLDEYGDFDALLTIEGPMAPLFDLGWYGADSDGGLEDGRSDFDFIYKASMAEPEPPELLTFFEVAHATAQFVLRGRPGSGFDGQWFPMSDADVVLGDPVTRPDGLEVFRFVAMNWDVDGDSFFDVSVTLNSNMLYPFGAEFNGWQLRQTWQCIGDLDFDFDVDLNDLATLLAHYGTESGARYWDGDLDGDRDVDLTDLANLLALYGTTCPNDQHTASAGDDCWRTPCGGGTIADFAENPIPPDFFGPGSDPFDGTIDFGDLPDALPSLITHRIDDMLFGPGFPSTADTPIELVELNLASCVPVTIMINGIPTQWDVQMGIEGPQMPGFMQATMMDPSGGVFFGEYFMQPIYTFTRTEPPFDIVVYDTGMMGIPPVQMQTAFEVPWSIDESFDVCTLDGFAAGVMDGPGGPCAADVHFMSVGTNSNQHGVRAADYPECP